MHQSGLADSLEPCDRSVVASLITQQSHWPEIGARQHRLLRHGYDPLPVMAPEHQPPSSPGPATLVALLVDRITSQVSLEGRGVPEPDALAQIIEFVLRERDLEESEIEATLELADCSPARRVARLMEVRVERAWRAGLDLAQSELGLRTSLQEPRIAVVPRCETPLEEDGHATIGQPTLIQDEFAATLAQTAARPGAALVVLADIELQPTLAAANHGQADVVFDGAGLRDLAQIMREKLPLAERTVPPEASGSPDYPAEGRLFDGRYMIDKRLGQGGFGQVFRARDEVLGRVVALKVLRMDRRASREIAAAFTAEAQRLASLNHPNIAILYEFRATPTGLCYFAMEHLDGQELARVLKPNEPLPLERTQSSCCRSSRPCSARTTSRRAKASCTWTSSRAM